MTAISAELYRAHRVLRSFGVETSSSMVMSDLAALFRHHIDSDDVFSEMISEPEPVVFDAEPYQYKGYTLAVHGYDAKSDEFIGFVREYPPSQCAGRSSEELLRNFREEVELLVDNQSIHSPGTRKDMPAPELSSTSTVVNLVSHRSRS